MDIAKLSRVQDSDTTRGRGNKTKISKSTKFYVFTDLESDSVRVTEAEAEELVKQLDKLETTDDEVYLVKADGKTKEELFEDDYIVGGFEQWVKEVVFRGETYFAFERGL